MPVASLDTDLRQFFSYSALTRLDRLEEADVQFTFEAAPLYLSCYQEAMDRLQSSKWTDSDPELLRYAQVFERFAGLHVPGVSPSTAYRISAVFYWLAGYSANATVLARILARREVNKQTLRGALVALLARDRQITFDTSSLDDAAPGNGEYRAFFQSLSSYLLTGEEELIRNARATAQALTERARTLGNVSEFVAGILLDFVLRRLGVVSLWGTIREFTSAPTSAWQTYAALQATLESPLIDLWPSQRTAVSRGLLDGRSSLVLRMPTSAGKTKMTELAFVNDLFTDDRRCLYLAPFRALVGEIESTLGPSLAALRIPVASLYGGAEANEMEVELTERARVVIGTPEKIGAVLRMGGGQLTDFGTIVLDEGHLLGSRSRGAAYEMQLATLRKEMLARSDTGVAAPRVIFLSAVLPNSATIAAWLGQGDESLAANAWHPTTLRVGILTWPTGGSARLRYVRQPGQPAEIEFFVPRVLEEDRWSELNPDTNRRRSFVFPKRDEKSAIAIALAFRYAAQGPVIIYTQQPRWADSIAEKVLDRLSHDRPIDTNLITDQNRASLTELADYVERRLGRGSILARALRVGIGLHHGGIPITIRLAIEDAFRTQIVRIMAATNTISQGVNFPVKTVILHSFPAGDAPVRDFWNLLGRAGRAMRETEGEVVLLQTGQTKPFTLRRFLDRSNMEPAESQILQFVKEILTYYPQVDARTIQSTLDREALEGEHAWQGVVNAIDTQLLELMVEDSAEVESAAIDSLVESLLATEQATEEGGSEFELQAIADLFQVRRERLSELIPTVEARRRFARTGVSATSALALDEQVVPIRQLLARSPEISEQAVASLIEAACTAPDLRDVNSARASSLAYVWIAGGSYEAVMLAGQFDLLDDAVHYVEEILSYTLPWVLNGLMRLVEPDEAASDEDYLAALFAIPEWAHYLPQFLRFGVIDPDLVWIMSLGIPDPTFARWMRDQFEIAQNRRPISFRDFLSWALEHQDQLRVNSSGWPSYFRRILSEVLERYGELSRILEKPSE